MTKRGDYAAIQTVMVDDPAFQSLSPGAKLTWYTLRLMLGASGIDVVRALVPTLQESTGIPEPEKYLDELIQNDWLKADGNVLWLRNVLKFNPSLNLSHKKHLAGVEKHLAGLPKLPIVNAFAEYYGLEKPFSDIGTEWLSKGYGKAIDRSSVRSHGHTVTRTPDTGHTVTGSGDKSPDASVDVDNWDWGDFAGWFRTTGHRLLWQGEEPPDWAAKDGRPWDVKRDLSILSKLHKKGEPLKTLKGVIEINTEPTCMLHYNQAGRWDYYYRQKAEWEKRERTKKNRFSEILSEMVKTA